MSKTCALVTLQLNCFLAKYVCTYIILCIMLASVCLTLTFAVMLLFINCCIITDYVTFVLVNGSSDFSFDVDGTSEESLTISDAYLKMLGNLNSILRDCDLSNLKLALIHHTHTPKGIKLKKRLKKQLKDKITAATSSFDLISVLDDFPFCNWLDTRLVEALSMGSNLKPASDLIKAYKTFLSQKKLCDVLLEFPVLQPRKIEAYITEVHKKIGVNPDKITLGDFIEKLETTEHVILDLVKPKLSVKHVKKGCLEISCFMPAHCSLNMYKMALYNRYEFYTIDLIHIEIGDHPLIFDPWISDLRNYPVREILYSQQEGTYDICMYTCMLSCLSAMILLNPYSF